MRQNRQLALWTALTVLFANLAALNILALLGDESKPGFRLAAALFTAVATAAAVYAKQRRDYETRAKAENFVGVMQVTDNPEGGKVYGLILDDDPGKLEDMDEIRFRVEKPKAQKE